MKKTKLKQYLEMKDVSISKAAREIGCTRVRLSQVVNGQRAGRKVAGLISKWSGGLFTEAELMQVKS
jgi:transcriptional regulator with XRE-family HTH domain